jgi:hypothetical protein
MGNQSTFENCSKHGNGDSNHHPFCLICENEHLRAEVRRQPDEEKEAEERIEKMITRLEEAMGTKDDDQGFVLAAQD